MKSNVKRSDFEINCQDETQLTKDIHHVTNDLFPIYPAVYKLSVVKGGNTNLLYLMTPNDNKHKKLLIRIYGGNTEMLINRKKEETLFYELGELRFGPKLYAIFKNGRIEQWYDNAKIYALYENRYSKKIAETMALMHCLQPESLKNECNPTLWGNIDKWFDIASNVQFANKKLQKQYKALNWNVISTQIDTMKSYLPSTKNDNNINKIIQFIAEKNGNNFSMNNIGKIAYSFMFESVLCHNDLIPANILYLPQFDEIKFIDFEYGAYNYRAFDIANHFCEYPGVVDDALDYSKFPDRLHMKEFIKVYMSYLCAHDEYIKFVNKEVLSIYGNNSEYDIFLNICVEIVVSFCGIANYFWGLWAIVMGKYSNIVHFNFVTYAHVRLKDGYTHSISILPSYLKFVERDYLLCKL